MENASRSVKVSMLSLPAMALTQITFSRATAMQNAAKAVSGDALRLWRVEKARLSIRWVRLKRASMLRGEYDPEKINAFFADWRAFGLSRIDEWCNLETTHRAFLDGIWRGVEYFDHWTGEEPEIF